MTTCKDCVLFDSDRRCCDLMSPEFPVLTDEQIETGCDWVCHSMTDAEEESFLHECMLSEQSADWHIQEQR